jgi:hypothetical protein
MREVVLSEDEVALDPGEHAFAWLITVPTSTASRNASVYGRIHHYLTAIAISPGLVAKTVCCLLCWVY